MAQDHSSLPQVPQMDWTEDAKLHKRYTDWRNEVQLILETYLLNIKDTKIKVTYVTLWADQKNSLDALFKILHDWTKPKVDEIALIHSYKS